MLFRIMKDKEVWVTPTHVPGRLNTLADQLSRTLPVPTEWELQEEDFQKVSSWKGPFQVGNLVILA